MPENSGENGLSLHRAHELLSFHLDNLPLAVIEWDSRFHISRWSRHAEALFGWPAEAVIAKHPFDFAFVHPEDAESVAEVIQQLLLGVAPQNVSTNRNLTRDGALVECEWHNSIQIDDQGHVVSVLSVVQDVTERNAFERSSRELLAREQALKSQFRAIFESAPGLYLVLTADDYRIVGVSDAYLEAIYTDREAIIGRQLFDVFPVTPDRSNAAGVEELGASLERVKRYGQPDTMPVLRYPIPDPRSRDGWLRRAPLEPHQCPDLRRATTVVADTAPYRGRDRLSKRRADHRTHEPGVDRPCPGAQDPARAPSQQRRALAPPVRRGCHRHRAGRHPGSHLVREPGLLRHARLYRGSPEGHRLPRPHPSRR